MKVVKVKIDMIITCNFEITENYTISNDLCSKQFILIVLNLGSRRSSVTEEHSPMLKTKNGTFLRSGGATGKQIHDLLESGK